MDLGNLSLELHNLATSSASDVLMCISRSLKDGGSPGGLATLAVVCLERFESPEGEKKQEDPGDVESDRRENELRTETTRFDETTSDLRSSVGCTPYRAHRIHFVERADPALRQWAVSTIRE